MKDRAGIVAVLVGLAIAGIGAWAEYPACTWNCTAGDVHAVGFDVVGPPACDRGGTLTAALYVTLENATNATRYGVRLIGDLYVDGRKDRSFDLCVLDIMRPGANRIRIAPLIYPCGASLEIRNAIVSWSASPESCSETPTCASRTAKCWQSSAITLTGTALTADFTTGTRACAGNEVVFTAHVAGGTSPYQYAWDFGDGLGRSTRADPTYVYPSPGTYSVELEVTDRAGILVRSEQDILVAPSPPAEASNGGPYRVGEAIVLHAAGGVEFAWSGPGGFTSSAPHPVIPVASLSHAGNYTVIVTDATGCSAAASTTVIITSNQPPAATSVTVEGVEDTPLWMQLAGTDPDQDLLTTSLLTAPSHGVTSNLDPKSGTLLYTPDRDFTGDDLLTFEVCDPSGACSVGYATVHIQPVNDPPISAGDAYTTREDTAVSLELRSYDPDGDSLTFSVQDGPSHGVITELDPAAGTATYRPNPDYAGPDVFTFEACDPYNACSRATLSILVTPVNDAPISRHDNASTPEDTPLALQLVAVDPDGDPVVYSLHGGPSHGTLEQLDVNTGALVYRPAPDYTGSEVLVFEACDPYGACSNAIITVSVIAVNDPPVALDQTRTLDEDTSTGFFRLAISDPDHALDSLSCDCITPPSHGTVERGPEHTVLYTPDSDYAGNDAFVYQVCDPDGLCATATVRLLINGANDNPSLSAEYQTTTEDTPISLPVIHNDPDGDPLECTVSTPSHGTVSPSTGTIVGPYPVTDLLFYTPQPGFHGADNFTITCNDGRGGSDSVSVEITVVAVNDAPTAHEDAYTLAEDTSTVLTLLGTDPDEDPLTFAVVTPPRHGTISDLDSVTGQLRYTPDADASGPDAFVFEVCDPSGACDRAVFSLAIQPVNDPPIASSELAVTFEDTPVRVRLSASDPESDPLTFTLLSMPSHGDITEFEPATGTFRFVPQPQFNGRETLSYRVCDRSGECDVATITISVLARNDAPTTAPLISSISAGIPNPLRLPATDPDADPLVYRLVSSPQHGQIESFDERHGTLIYTADPTFVGVEEFTFEACDPEGACSSNAVQLFTFALGGGGVGCDRSVIVSEIAWSGTSAGEADEWIELRNLSEDPVSLDGWLLRWRPKHPLALADRLWTVLPLSGSIGAFSGDPVPVARPVEGQPALWEVAWDPAATEDIYLIERGGDETVRLRAADLVFDEASPSAWMQTFHDDGDVIELLSPTGCTASTANVRPRDSVGWIAGDKAPPSTMERTDSGDDDAAWNWHTNLGVFRSGIDAMAGSIYGTPGTANSPPLAGLAGDLGIPVIPMSSVDAGRVVLPANPLWPRNGLGWRVVVVPDQDPGDVTLGSKPVDAGVEFDAQGQAIVEVAPADLPSGSFDLWIRTPSGEVFVSSRTIQPET